MTPSSVLLAGSSAPASAPGRQHQNPSNFRKRVLAPALEAANERLRREGRPLNPPITPHSLRHTYCSLLIAQGEDISTVAAQMRHADVSTTLKVYTPVMKHRREGVAERLDDLLFGRRSQGKNGAPGGLPAHPRRQEV